MNSGSLGGVEGVCNSFEARRFQGLEKNSQEETSAPGPPHLLAVLVIGMTPWLCRYDYIGQIPVNCIIKTPVDG